MANLKIGSQGDDVKQLQQALIDQGYDVGKTGADGILGKNTDAAIRAYQADNGLTVDGIAGKNTLGKLYGTTTTTTTPATTSSTNTTTPTTQANTPTTTPTTTTDTTTGTAATSAREDPLVQEAFALLSGHQSAKPGEYISEWLDEMDLYRTKYENRDPFSYDFNSDALYNQYKDQYILQGKMAMMDTMGQAAAMTGGYGNSYAQTVGQQAYNQQLNQLNEIMPQLYQMAYDRYNQEGQDLLNMFNLYAGLDERDYGRHQDTMNNWYTELDYYTNNYNTVYDQVYGEQRDAIADSQWQQTFDYNAEQDAIANDQWQKTFDYNAEQDTISNNQRQQQLDQTAEQNAKAEQQANWDKLASLIATGHKPTAAELKAAGMTESEAKTLQDAYTNSQSSNSSSGAKYKDIDVGSDVYNTIQSDVKRVTSLSQLQDLVQRYLALGYNPDQINALTAGKAAELTPEEDDDGTIPPRLLNPTLPTTGMVGGNSIWYNTIK